jgi:hypothetical protein
MRNAVEVGEAHADNEDFNDQAEQYAMAAAPLLRLISPEMGKGTIFVEAYGRQCLIQAVCGPLTPIGGVTLTVAGTQENLTWAAEAVGWDAAEQPPRLVERWARVRRQEAMARERIGQSDLVRDVFGLLPFRQIPLTPKWRIATVVAIAADIYEGCAFDRMPILADALQEAGCDNPEILTHCRQPGEHIKGCWCIDLILGKV